MMACTPHQLCETHMNAAANAHHDGDQAALAAVHAATAGCTAEGGFTIRRTMAFYAIGEAEARAYLHRNSAVCADGHDFGPVLNNQWCLDCGAGRGV